MSNYRPCCVCKIWENTECEEQELFTCDVCIELEPLLGKKAFQALLSLIDKKVYEHCESVHGYGQMDD